MSAFMPGGTQILKTALCALFLLGCAKIAGMPGQAVAQDAAGAIYAEHTGPRPGNAVITNKGWRCRDGFALAASGRCEAVKAPQHEMVRDGFWTCNPGFEQVDDRCRQIIAPANARINGNAWVCNPSYIRKGDRCQKLRVPANATVRGNSWSCNAGYRSNGKGQCARIVAPLNATVRGRGWTCNPGFTQTADGKSCRLVN